MDGIDEEIRLTSIFSGSVMVSFLIVSRASEEFEMSSRRKTSLCEQTVLMIKLISCWVSALGAKSLRHDSRTHETVKRYDENKICSDVFWPGTLKVRCVHTEDHFHITDHPETATTSNAKCRKTCLSSS